MKLWKIFQKGNEGLEMPKNKQNTKKPNEFKERAIYGSLLAVIALAALYAGGAIFMAFAALITIIMLFEFRSIISKRKTANKPLWYAIMFFYVIIPVLCFVVLRFANPSAAIWLVITIAASDIGGYAIGKAVGKHKLSPKISPNKTWEGLAGCVLFAAIASMAYSQMTEFLIIGALLALVSQAGDLTESMIKRYFGVKDSASIIPGHGGFMDRLDGYLYAAPLALLWQNSGTLGFL